MNEKELKQAGEELKKSQATLEANKAEFKEYVAKTEQQFQTHVEKAEKRLEEKAKSGAVPFRRPKSCYSDSKTVRARKAAEASK